MWRPQIHFELLEILGEGSQGTVHKALRKDRISGLSHLVAVKILHSPTAVGMWRQEFESLAKVKSKYCVQALSFERIGRRPALVLEFIDGISLSKLAQGGQLTPMECEEIAAQIETALQDLNQNGIFHGDLSPHNVLVDTSGQIRMLDFGLANCGEGQRRLTPQFAAPERLNGGRADLASDLYSLGRIEQFLRGEDLEAPVLAAGGYLALDPSVRGFKGSVSLPARRTALGDRVREFQRRRKLFAGIRTRSHVVKEKPRRTWVREFVWGAATTLALLATSSAQQIYRPSAYGTLAVKTSRWHKISLDGRDLGYTPVSAGLTSGREHIVEWSSAKGRGRKKIYARSGETLTLEDRDFSH